MAKRGDGRATDACLPEHWRDVREWSIEKRQDHGMWVSDVEAVLRSMARQLNASLEKYPCYKSGKSSECRPPSSLNHSRSSSSQRADPSRWL